MLLPLLILATLGYVAFAIVSIRREMSGGAETRNSDSLHPIAKFVFAGGVPVVVAGTMTYLFLIVGGSPTVQINAGSPSGMDVWSSWFDLWPVFLFTTLTSSLGSLIWLIVCGIKKKLRPLIRVAVLSLLYSVLAFFTVATYYPTA